MKRLFSYILITAFLLSNTSVLSASAEQVYKGSVETDDGGKAKRESDGYFTNEYEKIKPNNKIEMTVAQVLNGAVAQEGDQFFAEVTSDVKGGSGVLLPVGTIAHGTIKQISSPKRLGRGGSMEISFDYLVTPDGRQIPIEGEMSSKLSNAKGAAKIVAEDTGHVMAGAIIGSGVALNVAGVAGVVASSGYTILGGAAVGGIIALGVSLIRKGDHALITPGDEIKVQVRIDEELPVISQDALKVEDMTYPGLKVDIISKKREKDPFDNENTITLDLVINNNSDKTFSGFDIVLRDDLNKDYPPSVFAAKKNSIAFERIQRNSSISGTLSFTVDHPKRKHWLVFYDKHKRIPLARYSISNVPLESTLAKDKNKKKRKDRHRDDDVILSI
ncbi:hypothetical protein IKQ26_09085 [bacterium]|nr:hypothetical protein [bacterium]